MIYIVSGWKRTGTSMMMTALKAGGMDIAYSEAKEKRIHDHTLRTMGVAPRTKFYEFERDDYFVPGFPEAYEGKLIKTLHGGIEKLNRGLQYKVIYMRRPQQQVAASISLDLGPVYLGNTRHHKFTEWNEQMVEWMRARPGQFLSVDEVWFDEVLQHPQDVFGRLKENDWPIDVEKAAAVPDKSRTRHSAPVF